MLLGYIVNTPALPYYIAVLHRKAKQIFGSLPRLPLNPWICIGFQFRLTTMYYSGHIPQYSHSSQNGRFCIKAEGCLRGIHLVLLNRVRVNNNKRTHSHCGWGSVHHAHGHASVPACRAMTEAHSVVCARPGGSITSRGWWSWYTQPDRTPYHQQGIPSSRT